MNKTKWIISLIISFSMTSCFGLFDSGTKTIKGKFKLVWIDLQETQGIVESYDNSGSGSQIVPEYVFSVGHNDDFIIAKQHPTSGFDKGYEIDTTILNYFIVDMNNKILKDEYNKVWGPLSKQQFDSLRTKLKITDIKFDKNYPETYKY